jgi:REP element-mobilizing transposase RayT
MQYRRVHVAGGTYFFTVNLADRSADTLVRPSREAKRERGIWQRRYWEHQIRDELDLAKHVDYIHNNPVKHGWVHNPEDWPHSTLHGYMKLAVDDTRHILRPRRLG